MLAQIAFMKALNRNVVLAFNPEAKKHMGQTKVEFGSRNTEGDDGGGSARNRWALGKLELPAPEGNPPARVTGYDRRLLIDGIPALADNRRLHTIDAGPRRTRIASTKR